jgi:Fur family transcriptional regulator, iron response regulator
MNLPVAQDHDDPWVQRLRACGISPTLQRLRIAAIVLDGPHHMTAEQVLAELRRQGFRASKATVYNTLNLFAARGLMHHFAVDTSRSWFDSNTSPHCHFQDLESGQLSDVALDDVRFEKLPAPPAGMEVVGVDVVIRLRKRRGA